ncbi:hypothetical protein [Alloprevotella tannerae]|uniref:hypothetical protein n=1 Tax=Alloprevotella tannerae TaxID=76122 RepID=UPI0028EA4815|nr:hypothetical protein [Alloprevotella tannerae]
MLDSYKGLLRQAFFVVCKLANDDAAIALSENNSRKTAAGPFTAQRCRQADARRAPIRGRLIGKDVCQD